MKTILVADDEPMTRRLIRAALASVTDYRILEAENSRQALELARAEHPALLLLDLDMPEVNGFEVCRTLKADPATADIRVFIITGSTRADVEGYAFAMGADRFLAKPFSPREMRKQVAELLT